MNPDWRIYYGDGSTVDNNQSAPHEVPKGDVQFIRQRRSPGDSRFEHVRGEDYYCWDGGRWIGRSHSGFWQYLLNPGLKIVLFGYELPHEQWNKIVIAATNDPDFE